MEQVTVLVTGAGALIGQGILRCIRREPDSHARYRVLTGDPDARSSGHWLGDHAFTLPLANDPEFLPRVREIIVREGVDVVLIGTDAELLVFGKARTELEAETGARIVVASPEVVEIADDKLETARFLENNGLPFPLTVPLAQAEELIERIGFPLFAKPRRGARSRGVIKIDSEATLAEARQSEHDLIVQEYLGSDDEEYTAGCLVLEGKAEGVVVLRRDLRDGNTYRAYLTEPGRFEPEIARIAERLGVDGPCNFQFRVRDGEPVVFEINARFSGTTPLRALYGFNEVTALLRYLSEGAPIVRPALRTGTVLRVWSDIFVPSEQLSSLRETGALADPVCESFPFVQQAAGAL